MSRLISPSLSPNVSIRDVFFAIEMCVQPWCWYDKSYVTTLRDLCAKIICVQPEQVFPVISARAGLSFVVSELEISTGDEVILQVFTCVAVVNAIQWNGATPIYADIDQETLSMTFDTLAPRVTDRTRAIIIQHTFGLPCPDLEKICAFARERGIMIIEDCAHSLGALVGGKQVGTSGDVSVFSFGRDKIVSSVFGGFVVINEASAAQKFAVRMNTLVPVERAWVLRQLLHPILTSISLLLYDVFSIGKILHKICQELGIISRATSREEKMCGNKPSWVTAPYPGALAYLAIQQIKKLSEMNARREEIARAYQNAGLPSVQPFTDGRVWLRYGLRSTSVAKMTEYFRKHNIVLGDWYDQVIAPSEVDLRKAGYTLGLAPEAENVSAHIVNMPVYPRMSNKDVSRVISVYDQYVREYGNTASNQ